MSLRIENIKKMAKSIDSLEHDYPENLVPKHAKYFEITNYDRRWTDFYTKVASKTAFDYGKPRTPEQKRLDNFYGLLGEKAIKDILRWERRVLYNYNERDPEFFDREHKEPFDFAIPTKNGEYLTLEIKTTKEPHNHKNMIIRRGEWKKSDYAIAVKMLSFIMDAEDQTKIYGFIAGYLTKQEIAKLPILENKYPCFDYPCRAIELIKIPHPISELWQKIDSEAIHWES